MSKPAAPDTLVLVGAIEGAFGVRGEVRVKSFTGDPAAIAGYGPLYDVHGQLILTPKASRVIRNGVALSAPEIASREHAQSLRNTALYIPRDRLPPTEDDEFYHVDLIGCRVETVAGEHLGDVHAVHDFGAGELLEVRAPGRPSLHLPFTKAAIPVIDLKARKLVAIPPDSDE